MTRARYLGFAVVGVLAFTAAFTGIWDPDFFHHLAAGRALVRGTSFAEDPLLFSVQGIPGSIPPYWLGSLIIYLTSLPAGLAGPLLLVALLTTATALVLLTDALEDRGRWLDLAVAAAFVLLALTELRVRSAPRPEAFGVLGVAYTLLAVRRDERGRPKLLLAFPLVALVWTQIHVSVAIGLGIVALHVGWIAARAAAGRLRADGSGGALAQDLKRAALLLLAGAGMAALNPSNDAPLALALRFLASLLGASGPGGADDPTRALEAVRLAVEELHGPSAEAWTRPFGVLIAAALLSFLLHRSRSWGRELATIAAFAFFASTSYRFAALASVVAAPIAARNTVAWLEQFRARRPGMARAAAAAVAVLCLGRAATTPTLPLQPVSVALDRPLFPVRAADFLRRIGFDGRLYNTFGAGGYLEWTLDLPVLQDGRGLPLLAELRDLLPEPVDAARMARLDARWSFEALVISTEIPPGADAETAARLVAAWSGVADPRTWSLVALDDGGALYLRRTGRWAAVAARDEFRFLSPGVNLPSAQFADPGLLEGTVRELERAAREAPQCVRCRINLAGLFLEAGRVDEAGPVLDSLVASRIRRNRASLELLLAMRAELKGDLPAADEHYRGAIRHSADPAPVRRVLAARLMARNQDRDAKELVMANLRTRREATDLTQAAALARRAGDDAAASGFDAEAAAAARREGARAMARAAQRLAEGGRLQEARAAFLQAIAADPAQNAPLTGMGFLELQGGDLEAAADAFNRAVRLAPDDADAWFGLAVALEGLSDPRRAADAYRECLRLQPSGPFAADARGRLARVQSAPSRGALVPRP
jgi:tetratricopeptide (TPR) repeat protein